MMFMVADRLGVKRTLLVAFLFLAVGHCLPVLAPSLGLAILGRILVGIGPGPLSPRLIRAARQLADRLRAEWIVAYVETAAHARLSEREIEVLRLLAVGMSNREIAAELVISPGTAKTHVHHLCGKLGVRNRTEAAMRAKELGLL